jgi:hypothetical protein
MINVHALEFLFGMPSHCYLDGSDGSYDDHHQLDVDYLLLACFPVICVCTMYCVSHLFVMQPV